MNKQYKNLHLISVIKHVIFPILGIIILIGCHDSTEDTKPTEDISAEIAFKYAKLIDKYIEIQGHMGINSPTFSSRGLGYVGLTMYESVAQGSNVYQSVAPQLNGLGSMPKATKKVDWATSFNEAVHYIIPKIWPNASKTQEERLDSLYHAFNIERAAVVLDTTVINYSKAFGQAIADQIYKWSQTDGGQGGDINIWGFDYNYPKGEGYWTTPTNGQSNIPFPMHPYWGKNRTFVKKNATLDTPKPLIYSSETGSEYYKEFYRNYEVAQILTQKQREAALWWGDDPANSSAPSGHFFNLGRIIAFQQKLNLFQTCEMFAKVGMATADSFIWCWKTKYTYHTERPTSYIRHRISVTYSQFWPEPPFPAFPSGHSTQAAAAAIAISSCVGDAISFTDNTHEGRERDVARNTDWISRSFTSVWAAAEECGISRIYGGIHTEQDNTVGLAYGKTIAQTIADLNWKK